MRRKLESPDAVESHGRRCVPWAPRQTALALPAARALALARALRERGFCD